MIKNLIVLIASNNNAVRAQQAPGPIMTPWRLTPADKVIMSEVIDAALMPEALAKDGEHGHIHLRHKTHILLNAKTELEALSL